MSLRVSTQSLSRQVNDELLLAFQRLAKVQESVSSGKRINRLSDDPIGAVRVLDLRSLEGTLDQFDKNINSAIPFLERADTVYEGVENVLFRAKELALAMANDTNSDEERRLTAVEVNQLFRQLISLANTDVDNRFIFGGFKNGSEPFAEGTGPVVYSGDDGEISIQANASTSIIVNQPGNQVFQGAGVTGGVGIFDVLQDLEKVLKASTGANSISLAVNLDSTTAAGAGFTLADAVGTEATQAVWLAQADFSTDITVHDSIGKPHNLTFLFAKTTATDFEYRVVAKSDEITGGTAGNLYQVGLEGVLSFNVGGTLNTGASTINDITLTGLANGADDITFSAAGGELSFAGSTHLSQSSKVITLSQVNRNGLNPQLGRLDAALNQILTFRATMGARLNTTDLAKEGLDVLKLQTISQRSLIEDADALKVFSDFARLQTAFEAALHSASQVLLPSLLNFLR